MVYEHRGYITYDGELLPQDFHRIIASCFMCGVDTSTTCYSIPTSIKLKEKSVKPFEKQDKHK